MKLIIRSAVATVLAALFAATSLYADEAADAQAVVDKAKKTFSDFQADPNMGWFRDNFGRAQGAFIIPVYGKGGFIIGGAGGTGAMLGRDKKSGEWSQPAFYNMGAASIGFLAGVEVGEVVLMAMTQKGLDAFLSTKFQLGADASVAVGPVGAGGQVATADIVSFTRAKGLFGGFSVDGAVITPNNKRNKAYYGKAVSPTDIMVRRSVHNKGASELVNTVAKGAKM